MGDTLPTYADGGLAPPLAVAARALGSLLETMSLPPGAIHSLQEIETLGPIKLGQRLRGSARLERPRSRGNLQFITAAFTVSNDAGDPVLAGKSTVLVAGAMEEDEP